jgi:phosphohistidine phosphatase
LILGSPARRNLETAELLRARLPDPPRLVVQQDLYLADRGTMLSLLHQLDPSEQQVLVLGHNPGTAMLASWLCGAGESAEVDRMKRRFPTAAVAAFEFAEESWREIDRGKGRLLFFAVPEELG